MRTRPMSTFERLQYEDRRAEKESQRLADYSRAKRFAIDRASESQLRAATALVGSENYEIDAVGRAAERELRRRSLV